MKPNPHSPSGNRTPSIQVPDPTRAEFAAWLAGLPLANTDYCLDALEATLESFNARPGLPPALRCELAELALPTANMLAERAKIHFLDAPLPYSATAGGYLARGIALHHELGTAYTLAAFDQAYSGPEAKHPDRLLAALYRALQYLGRELLWTAQLYQNPGHHYWPALYGLYQLAEAHHLLHARRDDGEEPEPCQTPAGQFIRSLLFATANTRRLRQRDMPVVFWLLGLSAGYAWLGEGAFHGGRLAEFFLDLGGHAAPLRARTLEGYDPAGLRFLFTRNLAQALAQIVQRPETVTLKIALDPAVLLRVARSLGGVDKRKSTRHSEADPCRCVAGLVPLAGALSGPAGRREAAKPGSHSLGGTNSWSVAGNAAWADSRPGIWSGAPEETEPGGPAPTVIEGRIVNSSARGCCIIWPSTPAAKTRIGELIGVWLGSAPEPGFIGAIRWLECGRAGLRFGVELLSPTVQTVRLYDTADKPKGRALLLPVDPVLRPAPELLALPSAVRSDEGIRLRSDTGETAGYWVRELREGTPSFARYALQAMGSEEN